MTCICNEESGSFVMRKCKEKTLKQKKKLWSMMAFFKISRAKTQGKNSLDTGVGERKENKLKKKK